MGASLTLAVLSSALVSIAEEMGEALKRSSYSSIIREMLDFSCAIYDDIGRMVSTSPRTIPGLLGHMDAAVAAVVVGYGDQMREGDVFIANDPFAGGGSHVPDVHVLQPIYAKDRLLGFAVTNAHHIDFGGPYPGGESIHSTSIFHEGLRIPTMKLCSGGVENVELVRLIQTNVRDPKSTLGDLRSQTAACRTGEQRLLGLVAKYGEATVRETMTEVMDYSETKMRTVVGQLADGHVHFVDRLEGGASFEPVEVHIDLTVRGSEVVIDFTGTASQVNGPINMMYSATRTCCLVALRMFSAVDVPTNDGCFRPFVVQAPEGCVLNAVFPAACGIRHIVMVRLTDMLLHAFAELYPDISHAGAFAGFASMAIGGVNPVTKDMKVMQDDLSGALGAGRSSDGASAVDVNIGNLAMLSAEACEMTYPIRLLRNDLVCDSGGPGQFRGGLGVRRDYEILEFEQKVSVYSEQASPAFAPWGLGGGSHGASPCLRLMRMSGEESTFLAGDFVAQPGDVLSVTTGGGGGFGNPLDRDRNMTERDVNFGYVSIAAARRDYGYRSASAIGQNNHELAAEPAVTE